MAGHVFVIRGDLRKLACDAWLMPCSRRAAPPRDRFPEDYDGPRNGTPFDRDGVRTQPLPATSEAHPRIWLTHVGGGPHRDVGWYVDGAVQFLRAAKQEIDRSGRGPLFGRSKPLLALPVVGTGAGGAAERAGAVLRELLPALYDFTQAEDTDVALVNFEPAKYAAAQAVRDRLGHWPEELSTGLRAEAERLAELARNGRLALFLGAGIGVAAGLPDWRGLLGQLADQAGLDKKDQEALGQLGSVLDQASILERRLARQRVRIGQAVAGVIGRARRYALAHTLLAALPVQEVVTTNYDELFDAAWAEFSREPISVLPERIAPDARRWLLKMHGSVRTPDRIVLTRASYTRYDERLPALAGIVQAFLITRHMLFVGFSLTDDNFHRIVDAVCRVHGKAKEERVLGTSLSLGRGGLAEQLWEDDLRRVPMEALDEGDGFPYAAAARRLEIFLDYLAFRTRTTTHLLAGRPFDDVLSPGERRVRDALTDFWAALTGSGDGEPASRPLESVTQTAAWPEIERMLLRLGFPLTEPGGDGSDNSGDQPPEE